MALPSIRRFNHVVATCKTASVGTTPVAAYCVAPVKGYVAQTYGVLEGTITTAAAAIAVKINGGSDIGALSIPVGVAGTAAQDSPSASEAARFVNEGDVISFTPSGATGASIPATFHALIRQA